MKTCALIPSFSTLLLAGAAAAIAPQSPGAPVAHRRWLESSPAIVDGTVTRIDKLVTSHPGVGGCMRDHFEMQVGIARTDERAAPIVAIGWFEDRHVEPIPCEVLPGGPTGVVGLGQIQVGTRVRAFGVPLSDGRIWLREVWMQPMVSAQEPSAAP